MTIETRPRVGENVLAQRPIVFRMCILGPDPSILGIGNEPFLPRHGNELAPCLGQEISPVGLQPVAVPPVLVLGSMPPDLGRVGNSLDDELRIFHSAARLPWIETYKHHSPAGLRPQVRQVEREALSRLPQISVGYVAQRQPSPRSHRPDLVRRDESGPWGTEARSSREERRGAE